MLVTFLRANLTQNFKGLHCTYITFELLICWYIIQKYEDVPVLSDTTINSTLRQNYYEDGHIYTLPYDHFSLWTVG